MAVDSALKAEVRFLNQEYNLGSENHFPAENNFGTLWNNKLSVRTHISQVLSLFDWINCCFVACIALDVHWLNSRTFLKLNLDLKSTGLASSSVEIR